MLWQNKEIYLLTTVEMFMILEVTSLTNVGLYSARHVTTSLFKSKPVIP